jgi:hypothetical protein
MRETFLSRITAIHLALLSIGLIWLFMMGSYFGVNVFALPGYLGFDTVWCDWPTEGIGWHCFGDYHQFIGVSSTGAQIELDDGTVLVNNSQGRSLLGTLISDAFEAISKIAGFRASLICYLLLSAGLMMWPMIHATRGLKLSLRLTSVLTLSVLTVPFVSTLDRGQQTAFLVPLIYFALYQLSREKWIYLAALVAVAASIKPQFLILIFFFLLVRRWQPFIVAITSFFTLAAVSFLAHGSDALSRFTSWGTQMLNQDAFAAGASTAWPILYSWPTTFDSIGLWLTWVSNGEFGFSIQANLYLLFNITVTFVILLLLFFRAKRLGPLKTFTVLIIVATFSLGSLASYYLVVALAILAMLVFLSGESVSASNFAFSRSSWIALVLACLISMAPIFVPYSLSINVSDNQNWQIAPVDFFGPYQVVVTTSWAIAALTLLFSGSRVVIDPKRNLQFVAVCSFGFSLALTSIFFLTDSKPVQEDVLSRVPYSSIGVGEVGANSNRALEIRPNIYEYSGAEQNIYFPETASCPSTHVKFDWSEVLIEFSPSTGPALSHSFSLVGTSFPLLTLAPDGHSVKWSTTESTQIWQIGRGVCIETVGAQVTSDAEGAISLRSEKVGVNWFVYFLIAVSFLTGLTLSIPYTRRRLLLTFFKLSPPFEDDAGHLRTVAGDTH